MDTYELTIILPSDYTQAKRDRVLKAIEKEIEELGGKVEDMKEWGKKQFVHPVEKKTEGVYVLYKLSLSSTKVPNLSRALNLQEDLLRYLLVKG